MPALPKNLNYNYLINAKHKTERLHDDMEALDRHLEKLLASLTQQNVSNFHDSFLVCRNTILKLLANHAQFNEFVCDHITHEINAGREVSVLNPLPTMQDTAVQISARLTAMAMLMAAQLDIANRTHPDTPQILALLQTYEIEWFADPTLITHDFDPNLETLIVHSSAVCLPDADSLAKEYINFDLIKKTMSIMTEMPKTSLLAKKVTSLVDARPRLLGRGLYSLLVDMPTIDLIVLQTFNTDTSRITQFFNLHPRPEHLVDFFSAGLTYNPMANCFEYVVQHEYSLEAHLVAHQTPVDDLLVVDSESAVSKLFRLLIGFANYVYIGNTRTLYKNEYLMMHIRANDLQSNPLDCETLTASAQLPS